jgi:hypothetical protein
MLRGTFRSLGHNRGVLAGSRIQPRFRLSGTHESTDLCADATTHHYPFHARGPPIGRSGTTVNVPVHLIDRIESGCRTRLSDYHARGRLRRGGNSAATVLPAASSLTLGLSGASVKARDGWADRARQVRSPSRVRRSHPARVPRAPRDSRQPADRRGAAP